MIKVFLFSLILISKVYAGSSYESECKINLESEKHPFIIQVYILENEVSLEMENSGESLICEYAGSIENDIHFYKCGDYQVSFRDNMKNMLFGGRQYRCEFVSL